MDGGKGYREEKKGKGREEKRGGKGKRKEVT